jgi:hypothetical protein
MARPQRFCIFCGKSGLTHEHVWADWLKNYIPKDMTEHNSLAVTVYPTHSDLRRKKRSGDLRSRRLRIVCKNCNNGWMAKLQEKAKPYLLPLISGEVTVLDERAQAVVAAWMTMFSMVAEHFDLTKVSTSARQRYDFWKNQKPPATWKIWTGDYERGNWVGYLVHFALPISSKDHLPEIMDNGVPRPNTQTMTFTVGRLYITLCGSVTDIFEDWQLNRTDLLTQIWPFRRNLVAWPPKTTMNDRDADQIAGAFQRKSDEVGRKMVEQSWQKKAEGDPSP